MAGKWGTSKLSLAIHNPFFFGPPKFGGEGVKDGNDSNEWLSILKYNFTLLTFKILLFYPSTFSHVCIFLGVNIGKFDSWVIPFPSFYYNFQTKLISKTPKQHILLKPFHDLLHFMPFH